jgi:hypothetical protein
MHLQASPIQRFLVSFLVMHRLATVLRRLDLCLNWFGVGPIYSTFVPFFMIQGSVSLAVNIDQALICLKTSLHSST